MVAVSGCKTSEKTAQVKTEYRYVTQRDSVRVEKWDTVRVFVKGDTVHVLEKLHEIEYYSTIYRDTLRQSDTLRLEKIVQMPAVEKPIKWWRWFFAGIFVGIIIIFAAKILIKLYSKK